jgi:RHS repeat-associated protein
MWVTLNRPTCSNRQVAPRWTLTVKCRELTPILGSPGSNLLGSVQTPLTTIGYTYDELGRQITKTIGGVSSGVTFDALSRVTSQTNALSGGAFQYSYLGNTDRVASVAYPTGQSAIYAYEDSTSTPNEPLLSEIKNINASSGVISKFDYGYDAESQITSWSQQSDSNDPQKWAMQYDTEGKLTSVNVTNTTTNALLHQYAYLYDAAGNRTSEQIDGNVTGASYNDLNQLAGQSEGGNMVFSGTLSKPAVVTVGGYAATSGNYSTNFTGIAAVSAGTNSVSVVAQDVDGNVATNNYQVVVSPSSGSYLYDANGNLVSDGSRTYGWDAKNELVLIVYNSGSNAGNHTEFIYNGLGQRVAIVERTGTAVGSGTVTSTKQYVWAGGVIAEERDGSNTVTKRYFDQGEQRISSGTATNYFYTRDHLGSIRELIASDGATIAVRYSYDPFGRATQVSGSINCDFQYAGMYEHPTSDLNLTMYRAYNPNIGRWISRDPSGEDSGANLYAYCSNSPVDNCDLSGLHPVPAINYQISDLDVQTQIAAVRARVDFQNMSSESVFGYMNDMAGLDTSYLRIYPANATFTYTGTDFPTLSMSSTSSFTNGEINYIGVGEGFAARNIDIATMFAIITEWKQHYNMPPPSDNTLLAALTGYMAYLSPGGGSCMESIPSAFSSSLSL